MTLIHITLGAPQDPPDNSYIPKFVRVDDPIEEHYALRTIVAHLNGNEWFRGLKKELLLPAQGLGVDFQKLYDNSSFLGNFASDYKKDFVILDIILRGAWVTDIEIQKDKPYAPLARITFDKMEQL